MTGRAHSTRRRLLGLVCAFVPAQPAQAEPRPPALTHGPFRGHCDPASLHVWARAAAPGEWTLTLRSSTDGSTTVATATADAAHDLTLQFRCDHLPAATVFDTELRCGAHVALPFGAWPCATAMPDSATAARVAFGSCSNELTSPEQPIWGQILARAPHALVLLGDTPYIDSGTVEARRRRHREFFAFAPVAATLRAVPTWATWDDHDYALNDAFGAVAGSETARPVFVDYHAHAGHGDGERGIWTSFRRGPVEVFVLDTRSGADSGPSPLAPGERTLLGGAQLAWLQRGLRASTAPFRVLACGMVWNAGVRTGKQDCWGNWSGERDALLRWLGTERIGGVVLLGGDVHRSRVIVHPVRALAGYDVPEFVTSPLAHNVIEANAVAVPGLVFDAGEPHSALLLDVDGTVGAAVLTARFVSGDGREFHVRRFPLAELQRPDAAATYRALAGRLEVVFGAGAVRFPPRETDTDDELLQPAWRDAVVQAAPLFAAWDGILDEPHCRFGPVGKDGLSTEWFDHFLAMRRLEQLATAAGHQAASAGDAASVRACLRRLLAIASHQSQQSESLAWAVAAEVETAAARLVTIAAGRGDEAAIAALRALLREHIARRPGAAAAVATAQVEAQRMFDATLRATQLESGSKGETARRFASDVRRAFVTALEPAFAAGAQLPDLADAAARDRLRAVCGSLHEQCREQRQRLQRSHGEAWPPAGIEAAAELGLLLAGLLSIDLVGFVDAWWEAGASLFAAASG
jgi:alkaline phosphatase D